MPAWSQLLTSLQPEGSSSAPLSKLKKSELVEVASAYWLFLREPKGAPALFDVVLDLAKLGKGKTGISHATNAIYMQDGLDTERVRAAYALASTSTQAPKGEQMASPITLISEDVINADQGGNNS